MSTMVPRTALVAALLTLTQASVASTELPGAEGVLLDISVVDPRNSKSDAAGDTDAGSASSVDSYAITTASGNPVSAGEQPVTTTLPKTPQRKAAVPANAVAIPAPTPAVSVPAPETVRVSAPAPVVAAPVKVAPKTKKAVEVSASTETESSKDSVLQAIVDVMRPKEQVAALENDRLSIYLSEKVAFAQYEKSAERFDLERARTHMGFLYSEERDTIFQGGLALDTSFTNALRFSFGTRAYVALLSEENTDVFAGSFGVETAYKLPVQSMPLEFGASLYYAPDILTFGLSDRIIDAQVDVTLPIRSQLSVFGGIRLLQVDTRPDDREVDNRVHLGMRWDFL